MADINKLIEANEYNKNSNATFASNGTIHSVINRGPEITSTGDFSSRLVDLWDLPRYYVGDTDD